MPSLQNYWYSTNKLPKINWLHPLARGLKFFAYPTQGGMTDLVSGKTGTLANGSRPATKTTKYGTVRYFAGGNLQFSGINHGIGTGPLTMWARHRWDGTSGSYKTPICINTNLTLYAPFSSANRNLAADSTFGGQGSIVYSGTNVLTSGVWADVSIAFGGSSTSSTGYIDGKAQSTSSSMNYSNIGTTGHINVGMGQGTSEYARGDTKYAIVWGRKLSAEEQLFLTNFGPESLFIQPREFLFLADVVAGGITGTGAGTLSAITGSGTGIIEITGTGAGTLSAITGSSSGTFYGLFTGTAAGDLAAVTASSSGTFTPTGFTGTADANLAAVTGSASGTFYGAFTGTGAGDLQAVTGSASGTFSAADFFGSGAGTLSAVTASGTGILKYSGTGAGSLQSVTGSGAGYIEITGTGAGDFQAIIGSSSGSYAGNVTGTAAGTLAAIIASASGNNGEIAYGKIFVVKPDKYNFKLKAEKQTWSLH
jgi:hypothetical protein